MATFTPSEIRMKEQFMMETTVVMTQVENKHRSLNRKVLSWITRKRWREVISRKRSAIISAIKQLSYI